jgi:hypothetical protein
MELDQEKVGINAGGQFAGFRQITEEGHCPGLVLETDKTQTNWHWNICKWNGRNANPNFIQNKGTQTPGSIQPISIRCEKNVPSE